MPYSSPDKNKAYWREYRRRRYQNDPQYRDRVRQREKERYHNNPEVRKKHIERANRQNRLYRKMYHTTRDWVIDQLGGACIKCGYDECNVSLDIHHKDGQNDLKPSYGNRARLFYKWWKQGFIPKDSKGNMELLCANCHRELHFN